MRTLGIQSQRIRRSLAGAALAATVCHAGWQDEVGYTDLSDELGAGTPTGTGITASQVEAESGGNYAPDETNTQFNDTTINEKSGTSGPSNHATTVGKYLYGNTTSMTPDINIVDSWEANDWINTKLLANTPSEDRDIQNHSWIGTFGNDSDDQEAMRRYDYMINESDFVGVVGVNNGASSNPVPRLMAHNYNGISVGCTDGDHSYGDTNLDEPGRVKPEIVVPLGATSYATPVVGSAAGILLETVDGDAALSNARTSAAIKAITLVGATKDEFSTWDRTATRPLDEVYGAGELNVYNSYQTLVAGEQEASTSEDVGLTGWDVDQMPTNTGNSLQYFFEITQQDRAQDLSAVLTWNRSVSVDGVGPFQTWNASVADLRLELYSATNYTLDKLLDYSDSEVDNVEHIYQTSLSPGRYAFELTGDTADQEFSLAWFSTAIPEPTSAMLLVAAGLFALRRRC